VCRYSRKKIVVGVCFAIVIVLMNLMSFYSYNTNTYEVFNGELTVPDERGTTAVKQVLYRKLSIQHPWISKEALVKAVLRIQMESAGDIVDRPIRIYFNDNLVKVKMAKCRVPNNFEIDITDLLKEYTVFIPELPEIYIVLIMKPKNVWIAISGNLRWRCIASIRVEYISPFNLIPFQATLLALFISVGCYGQKVNLSNIVKWGFLWYAAFIALLGFMFIITASRFAMPRFLESGGCLIFLSLLIAYFLYAPPGSVRRSCNGISMFILAPLQKALAFLYKRTAFMRHDYVVIFLGGIICLTGLLLGASFKELFIMGASITVGGWMWLIIKMFSLKREAE